MKHLVGVCKKLPPTSGATGFLPDFRIFVLSKRQLSSFNNVSHGTSLCWYSLNGRRFTEQAASSVSVGITK
jgi:hypothetical protein